MPLDGGEGQEGFCISGGIGAAEELLEVGSIYDRDREAASVQAYGPVALGIKELRR